jgi:PAS domain S-box-containing protein
MPAFLSDIQRTPPTPRARYALAVLAPAAVILVTKAVQHLIQPTLTPTFSVAVAIAALFGGWGPGIVASVLSAVGFMFFPHLMAGPEGTVRLIQFLVIATVITWTAGAAYRHRWQAASQAAENARLRGAAETAAVEAQEAATRAEQAMSVAEEEAVNAEEAAHEAAVALEAREEAERSLRESQTALADFFDTASTGLHWIGEDGTILRANQAELDLLGYKREEYIGHHIAEFHVDSPVIEDILRRLRAGEPLNRYPARMRCKDGRIIDVSIDSSAYFSNGRFVHSRCFTRDVTRETQLYETTARFAAIVASSSDAIIGKTLDGVVTSWNPAAERIFGYAADEIVGQSIYKLIPEELHAAEREVLDRLRRGETVAVSEAERIRKDGRRIWISLSVSPVRDATGVVIGAASIKRDVTEQRLATERMRDVQRLRAVGQLAGGVAHEANNQMLVVLGASHFLLKRRDLPSGIREDLQHIYQAAERTAAITQQLLAFGRRQVMRLEDVDLNRVVQGFEPVLRRTLAEHHELVLQLGLPANARLRADPGQLEQVLLNLALNARDAMPRSGRLTISTGVAQPDALEVVPRHVDGASAGYACLTVEDTGRGMDSETLARAFEPFFTTKAIGEGTGLGLSVVDGIVNQMGGYLRVASEPGTGTRFALCFPIVPAHVEMPAGQREFAPAGGGRVVMVVEDAPTVRQMAARALTEAGYAVLEAGDGLEALEKIRGHDGPVDLVITDLGMPAMNGQDLARCLREERPNLPILFISGYGETENLTPYLQKPFSPDELVAQAGALLASATVSRV